MAEKHSGLLSKGIKLSYKTSDGGSFKTLKDLQEIPELGGTPNKVDVTTLDDEARAYINGLIEYGDLSFKFLYDKTQFLELNGLTGVIDWKIEFPDTLTATFSGESSVKIDGEGIESATSYTLNLALSSKIAFA